MRAEDYTYCPDCGKKGVTLRLSDGEDQLRCRYCNWFAFMDNEGEYDYEVDKRERARDDEANNPERRYLTS